MFQFESEELNLKSCQNQLSRYITCRFGGESLTCTLSTENTMSKRYHIKTVKRNCLFCDSEFEAPEREVNRGNGKFCSRSCSSKHAAAKRAEAQEPNVECAYCAKPFYKNATKMKNSKSGLFFCCREHKDLAQRLESGIPEIHPDHYGTDGYTIKYREVAFRYHPVECNRCGYNEIPEVLEVHHIDRNRSNNHPDNLEVLCPTCHAVEHFQSNDGKWARNYK